MGSYIRSVQRLTRQARRVVIPPEESIQAALRVLARSPVIKYPPFMEAEVRLLGAYRAQQPYGIYDPLWQDITNGLPEAWIYAVHEAAEMQAFADMGVNPFVADTFRRNLEEAHLQAAAIEIQYLQDWAQQIGHHLPELALETENPIRKQFSGHLKLLTELKARLNWPDPTDSELTTARQFWTHILRGERA